MLNMNFEKLPIDSDLTHQLAGTFFGYPQCCIDEFKIKQAARSFPWREGEKEIVGIKGLRPCEEHWNQIRTGQIKLQELISNRECKLDFPYPDVVVYTLNNFTEWKEFKNKNGFF